MNRVLRLPSTTHPRQLGRGHPLIEVFLAWCDLRRQRAALARLDERLLDDIGVSRVAALVESRKFL